MNASSDSVLLTYLCTTTVSQSFMDSVCRTYEYEKHYGTNRLWRTFPVASGPLTLDKSRNESVKMFLEQSECKWLWIVDSDMGFRSETLSLMVETAENNNLQVLSGLYYGAFPTTTDFMGGWNVDIKPIVFSLPNLSQMVSSDLPEDTLVSVGGVGAGCVLLTRDLLVSMQETYGDHWFTQIPTQDGYSISEDLSFCLRLKEMDVPVVVHTGIKASHHKSVWITL